MVRRYLRFYRIVYQIGPPYNILFDGNFIFTVLKNNINIADRLGKLLQGEQFSMFILRSSLDELRSIGEKGKAALDFGLQQCTVIEDSDIAGANPFDKTIGYILRTSGKEVLKKKRYFVCTQDRDLRAVLGSMPGNPLLYLNQVSLVMEPPSQNSLENSKKIEAEKISLNTEEKSILDGLGIVPGAEEVEGAPVSKERKKRKATAPNPLSNLHSTADSNRSKRRKLEKIKKSQKR